MLLRALSAAILCIVLVTATLADDTGSACDRTGDNEVTVDDALTALRSAVDNCLRNDTCDANGDERESAADALALLRYAVGLPVTLQCTCLHRDECFEDEDCADYPGEPLCNYTLCVECLGDDDCADGEHCEFCHWTCVPN